MAKVAAAHGLRGALKLRCFTARASDVGVYGPLYDERGERRFEIQVLGPAPGGVLARAQGIGDRSAAEALRGLLLFVPRTALPDPGPDEFYHSDLEGLRVEDSGGTQLGTVRGLENFGAGDLLEIAGDDGRVLTLPFDRRTVPVVDLERGRLVVEPPAELIAEPGAVSARPAPWAATVLTLFPEMFPGPLGHSLAGRALEQGAWSIETLNLRDFATDRHHSVDDLPFGGGAGMVMRPDVVARALDAAGAAAAARPVLYLSARGVPLTQHRVERLAEGPGVVVLCGRFEGIDQRVVEARALEEVSLGDVVLSGGEPAAIALLDACVRLLPGVVGRPASLHEESFAGDLLEYPHYTRPQVWEGHAVPDVLLSGHHERIRQWRRHQAELATRTRRPDLWARHLAAGALGRAGAPSYRADDQ